MQQTAHQAGQDVDQLRILSTLRRYQGLVLTIGLLGGASMYALTKQQPPVYEAVSQVLAVSGQTGNTSINNTLVAAPALPQGGVEQALHSTPVVEGIIGNLDRLSTQVEPAQAHALHELRRTLARELATNSFKSLKVRARVDAQLSGTFELRAQATLPFVAQALANAAAEEIVRWDSGRASVSIERAQLGLQQRIELLDKRLSELLVTSDVSASELAQLRKSLLIERRSAVSDLQNISALRAATIGTLTMLGPAALPSVPIGPQATRNAVLSFILSCIFASAAALLLDPFKRRWRIYSERDLRDLLPSVLGGLPLLRAPNARRFRELAKTAAQQTALAFVRVNVMHELKAGRRPMFLVTSANRRDGTSFLTCALADSLANCGLQVLLIDADHTRSAPVEAFLVDARRVPNAKQYGAMTFSEALGQPERACPLEITTNLHVLPVGEAPGGIAWLAHHPNLELLLLRMTQPYDVVLVNGPSALEAADTFTLAQHTGGLLFNVRVGATQLQEVQRMLAMAGAMDVPLLGFVLSRTARTWNVAELLASSRSAAPSRRTMPHDVEQPAPSLVTIKSHHD